jgi:branched-chain amino acid transport system ATP-binding protein
MTGFPIIEARGLVKRFGGLEVLRGIDFAVGHRELRCLIGPNGAGKSTFFKCLTGQLQPCEGAIAFKGDVVGGGSCVDTVRLGIGIKTQVPSLYDGLSVYEHIWLAVRYKLSGPQLSETVQGMIEKFGLAHLEKRLVGQLPHGQRQLVEIAMVAASRPDLILLDEPAAGLSHQDVERLAELLLGLRADHSLIIVEHDMNFVRMIGETVTVLHQGRILVEADVDTVMRDRFVRDVYLGRREAA